MSDSRSDIVAAATLMASHNMGEVKCRDCDKASDVYVMGSLGGLCLEHSRKREEQGWEMDLGRAPNPILRKAYLTLLEWSKEPISKT